MESSPTNSGAEIRDSFALEHLPIAVCILDHQGVILEANRETFLMTGLSSVELCGVSIITFFHESDQAGLIEEIHTVCISASDCLKVNKRFLLKDHSHIWVRLSIRLLKTGVESHSYVCTLENTDAIAPEEDTSEQKRIQEQLKESEARFRSVASALTPRIFQMDLKGIITYANRPNGRLIKGDFIGTSIFNFLNKQKARDVLQSAMDTCRKKKEAVSFQTPYLYEDGLIRYYLIQLSPVLTDDEVVGFAMIRTDISTFKTAHESLEKTNVKLQSIVAGVDATGIGVFEWDIAGGGKVTWDVNTHKIFGVTPGEFEGNSESFEEMIHPEDAVETINEINFAVKNLHQNNTSHRIVKADTGEVRWISTRRIITRDSNGSPLTMTGVVWDITDEKQQEALKIQTVLLESQNRELKEFTYIASHDLQSPLRTLGNFVQLLEEDSDSQVSEDAKWYLSVIKSSTVRMKDLIQDLLTYSRIGRHRDKVEVNLQVILESVINDLNLEITNSGARIEVGALPTLLLYETEIRLLFQNLLSNSIKYRKPDATPIISVEAKDDQNSWCITIRDNGIGIESQYFEKIFMVFQRLHDQTEFEGNGIGLAHCRKIIQLHEGTISVDSEVGVGSVFSIKLPKYGHRNDRTII